MSDAITLRTIDAVDSYTDNMADSLQGHHTRDDARCCASGEVDDRLNYTHKPARSIVDRRRSDKVDYYMSDETNSPTGNTVGSTQTAQ